MAAGVTSGRRRGKGDGLRVMVWFDRKRGRPTVVGENADDELRQLTELWRICRHNSAQQTHGMMMRNNLPMRARSRNNRIVSTLCRQLSHYSKRREKTPVPSNDKNKNSPQRKSSRRQAAQMTFDSKFGKGDQLRSASSDRRQLPTVWVTRKPTTMRLGETHRLKT